MLKADIHHITRLRVGSDGEGVRSVVFMHGCPLSCFWCCNPETRFMDNYKTLSLQQLDAYISKDKPYYLGSNGGITFSGGEPLLHSYFIAEYIKSYCKDFSVNIETSLYTNLDNLHILYPYINEWYIDFKVSDEKKHIEYTRCSNRVIKRNLFFLSKKIDTSKIVITFPIIPNYNTSIKDLFEMMDFLQNIGINKISLHPYRKSAEIKQKNMGLNVIEVPEIDRKMYDEIKNILKNARFEFVERNTYIEKEKCKYLKQIRKRLCQKYDIPLEIKDCFFEGDCTGTCSRCDYELSIISKYIDRGGNSI